MENIILPSILILIAAAVFVVMIFKKLNISPVLGYLVAGAAIGDYGFKIVYYKQTELLAELGVVFLLFAIGLELSIERLKAMRKYVFGLGSLQVVITTIILSAIVVIFTNNTKVALIIGGGLALSSTAIVLQVLNDTKNQSTQVGRISLAILLQQDFIVVPLLVIVPLLANSDESLIINAVGLAVVKAIIVLIGLFVVGRIVLRPLFNIISSDNMETGNELFIALTLLIVLSAAAGTDYMGLSPGLGAFAAGILVAETEFRTQAEESIHPFKGLLLGLFFMSVGMTIDVNEIYQELTKIIIFSLGLIVIKSLIIIGLCMLFGFEKSVAVQSGLLLGQGGEFAFILFNLAMDHHLIDSSTGKILLLVVTCSMAFTPLLASMGEWLATLFEKDNLSYTNVIQNKTRDLKNHVIIGGFGQVGKMVAKLLEAEDINYIAIDINEKLVTEEDDSGFHIFKGDISQYDTLKAAGADRALTIIIATDNQVTIKKALRTISSKFAGLEVVVRSKDLRNSYELYEAGAHIIIPSDYEIGLQLGGTVLRNIGISEYEINRLKSQFRAGNYVTAQLDEDL
ncbi:MAG: Glutathione-regulated potassium-efflux system protein, partial [Pseudomonadota bacterium]